MSCKKANDYCKSGTFSGIDKYDNVAKKHDIKQMSENKNWRPIMPSSNTSTSTVFQPGSMWPPYSVLGVNTMASLLQSESSMNSIGMIAYPSIPATSILTSPATNEIAVVTTSSSVITSTTTTVESTSSPDNSNSIRNNQTTRCKSCILVPPESGFPSRLGKDKPPGCKTIFVGGLPENSTDEFLKDMFNTCGDIRSIRISPKRYAHIQFFNETAVDKAIAFSGYGIKMSDESPITGRLQVNYVNARDDQREWEREQLRLKREKRQHERQQARCSNNIMSVGVRYTESEANMVIDKIKNEDVFAQVIPVAVYWLDKGECTKRNVNIFYTMLQTCTSHIRRLINEKNSCENEFRKAKEKIKTKLHSVSYQVGEIEKLFVSSSRKKVWDHFTKAQRKTIDSWKKHFSELKNWNLETSITDDDDDEMDVSDTEEDAVPAKQMKDNGQETNSLKNENRNLRCQMEAFKNEVDVVRSDLQLEVDNKTNQIELLTQSYKSLQEKYDQALSKISNLEIKLGESDSECGRIRSERGIAPDKNNVEPEYSNGSQNLTLINSSFTMSETDAKILSLISIFLHIHPFGVGLDYICSYLQKFIPSLRTSTVEDLLDRLTILFHRDISGVGVNMERKWKFIGFNHDGLL